MPFNVNDSIPPSSAPQTIIGAVNALAYQIRQITGGETWKSTPPSNMLGLIGLGFGENLSFQSSGEIGTVNDLIDLRNGDSTLKLQAEKSNQQVDRFLFNWFPDKSLNSSLTPGGLYFGYFYGHSQIGLQDTGISFKVSGMSVCDIETYPNQFIFQIPQFGLIRLQQPGGGGQMLQWTPYIGLRMYGAAAELYLEANSGLGTKLTSPSPATSALSVAAVGGQAVDVVQFKDALGFTKLAISKEIKLSFPESDGTPTDTATPAAWVEVKIDGQTAYIPAYR